MEQKDVIKSVFRPKTMGDLRDALEKGVKCEIVSSSKEIASIYLDGWLKYSGRYKTSPSVNDGWTIFEKI